MEIKTIIQIGCGGNGGYLTSFLSRYLANNFKNIEYILIDGDKVEEKNLIRQNFITPDLGKNKAEVLALRYGEAFNYPIKFIPTYFNISTLKNGICKAEDTIIIGCVDNHKTRSMINNLPYRYWIDIANEFTNGQVFINDRQYNMFDYYPDIKIIDDHPDDLSCAEHLESGQQSLAINMMGPIICFNIIDKILTNKKLPYYLVEYNSFNASLCYRKELYEERKKILRRQQ